MKYELKRRGFVDGVSLLSPCSGEKFTYKSDSLEVFENGNIASEDFYIFYEGKFAEILPQFEVNQIGYAWDDGDDYPIMRYYVQSDLGTNHITSATSSKYGSQDKYSHDNFSIEEPNL